MIKVLAWSTLAIAILFVALSLTAIFGWESLDGAGWWIAMAGVVPLAVLSILLVLAILVAAGFTSNTSDATADE